jgi:hypothetical protein
MEIWLSPENQVALGGYCGGHSPPKNGPIFYKKSRFKYAKYDST